MRLAEVALACERYPLARPEAVEHVLWALRLMWPYVEAGDDAAARDKLAHCLARYEGDADELAALGVRQVAAALPQGRVAVAGVLGHLRLLAPVGGPPRWVIVGAQMAARDWVRARGISMAAVVVVTNGFDVIRLRGLSGRGVRIVQLAPRLAVDITELGRRLQVLRIGGAQEVSPGWWPQQAGAGDAPPVALHAGPPPGA